MEALVMDMMPPAWAIIYNGCHDIALDG